MSRPTDKREEYSTYKWEQGFIANNTRDQFIYGYNGPRKCYAIRASNHREFVYLFGSAEECAAYVKEHNKEYKIRKLLLNI